MERLVLRLIMNAAALVAAIWVVPGIEFSGIFDGSPLDLRIVLNLLLVALIFGLVNAVVRPILKTMTCAITALTLGLFVFVINALMLLLTAWIAGQFDLGFEVAGFVPALLGAIVTTVVSVVMSLIVRD
jgi:putative membrane protein